MQGSIIRGLADVYVEGRRRRGELTGDSPRVTRTRLEGFVRVVEAGGVDSIPERASVNAWAETLAGLSAGSRRAYIGAVRGFCAWLVIEGHLIADPSLQLVRPREPRRPPRALDPGDVAALMRVAAQAGPRDTAIVAVMVGMGLRCVEVSRLDVADREASDVLRVVGKGGHERIVPIPAEVASHLDAWLAVRGSAPGPLFCNARRLVPTRIDPSHLSKVVARLAVAAGVHRRPGDGKTAHALRHTCASDVLAASHDVRLVQELLGHQSLATTQIYLRHSDPEAMRAAMSGRQYLAA